MHCRPWLERVAEELAGRGLPAGVRVRLLDELRDHLEDLAEGGTNVAALIDVEVRMGSPEVLAEGAATDFRQSSWVRRHPLLVFGLAPVPAALLGLVAYLLAFAATAYGVDAATRQRGGLESLPHNSLVTIATGFTYSIRFVPFVAMAAAFGWLAIRSRMGMWWLAAAVIEVALLAGAMTVNLNSSDLPGKSQLMVGFCLPLEGWSQGLQVLLTLAVGFLFVRASNRRQAAVAR